MRRWQALALAAGLALTAWLVWQIGPDTLVRAVNTLGWRLPLCLTLQAPVAVLDALAWRYAFPEAVPPFGRLVAARLAGEAVNATTPTATLGGEPLKAWLVAGDRIPLSEALASVVIAKTALLVGHLAFIALALGIGLGRGTSRLLLAPILALAAAGVLATAGFLWTQLHGLFGASARVLGWLGLGDAARAHLHELDAGLRRYYRARRGRFLASAAWHFLGWVAGSLEVWVVLALLGVSVDPVLAAMVEAFATAIRAASFLVPGGVGIQESGLAAILAGVGLGAGSGLALGLVRRLREGTWALLGYAVLLAWRGRWGAPRPPGFGA